MKRGYQAAQFGSQPESQFNGLGNSNKFNLDNRAEASPMMSQTYSQRSVGNGGLQRGTHPSTRSNQLSLPNMSQLGGMSQTQQQAYTNRPMSSGFIPASQPALSGVFRPGSAPQRPTSSQLDMPTASQWTQPAVTSGLQGLKSGHQGGLLQPQMPASNQNMLRPKQVSLLRTTAAAPHLQGRPGSAPGLLSSAPPTSSPAQTPHHHYNQLPSYLQHSQQQQQQHFRNQQQQRPQIQQGSQGGIGADFNLLGSQQQLPDLPIAAPSPQQQQQQGYSNSVMALDDGSAGTGVALGSDPPAAAPAGPTAQQQRRQTQPAARTSAAANRLGPRLRGLLQELPPISQQPGQFDVPPPDAAAAAPTLNVAVQPGARRDGANTSTAPTVACSAVVDLAGVTPTAAAAPVDHPAAPAAAQTPAAAAAQPALDSELVMKRIGSLEEHCSSMSAIIHRDIPLLLQQQDSSTLQLQSLKGDTAKGNAALEARMQELTSSVASFMDGLKAWQLQQQQQMQQVQEQAAKQQPQLVLSHATCQTSPGLVITKGNPTAPAAAADSVQLLVHSRVAAAKTGHTADHHAAGAIGLRSAAQAIVSPSGKRYIREPHVNKPAAQTHLGLYDQGRQSCLQGLYRAPVLQPDMAAATQCQQQLQPQGILASPAAVAAADHPAAASIPDTHAAALVAAAAEPVAAAAESKQDVDNTGDHDGEEVIADAPSPQQRKKPTRQTRRKPASRARKPAAKPRGKAAAAAAAKAAKAQAEAAGAATAAPATAAAPPAAVNGSGKQHSSGMVQTKLNFGSRMTRSAAAKDASAVEAAVTASLVPEGSPGTAAVAAGTHVPASPATGTSTDVFERHGGVTGAAPAAAPVEADSDAPPAWLLGSQAGAAIAANSQQQLRGSGRTMSRTGAAAAAASGMRQQQTSQARNKQQQQVLASTHSAAASGTAAAASGSGRQFQRRSTPPPAARNHQPAAAGSGMMPKTVAAGAAAYRDLYSDLPGSPPGPTVAMPRPPAATQLPPTKARGPPATAPVPPAINRGQQRLLGAPGVAAAAGSGIAKQAVPKLPPAARSGANTAAAAARVPARPTYSGAGGCTRPTCAIQQQQQQRVQPQVSGGTSRLLGMKRDRPEPSAPARSSVQMLFGEMDSDSMDCVLEADSPQQQVVTGPMHRAAGVGGVVAAAVSVSLRSSSTAAVTGMLMDEGDISQQVAACMAQHRNKQRRTRTARGSSGFAR